MLRDLLASFFLIGLSVAMITVFSLMWFGNVTVATEGSAMVRSLEIALFIVALGLGIERLVVYWKRVFSPS